MNTRATLIERTLDNGMKIIVRENPLATDVSCQLNYKVSSRDESTDNAGINTVMFRTLLKDSTIGFPEDGIRKKGFFFDDFSSATQYIRPEELDQAFERYCRVMISPVFTKETLIRIIEADQKSQKENRYHVSDRCNPTPFSALVFPVSGYGNPPYPTPISAAQIDLHQVQQWHQQFYSPENAILVIVGNVNAEEVARLATNYFNAVPARSTERTSDRQELHEPGQRYIELQMDTKLPRLLVGFNLPGIIDPENRKSAPALEVLAALLDQNITNRLVACSGNCVYAPVRYASVFKIFVTAMTCDQSLKELEVALNQWLQSIKDGTLSKGELDAARESALSELAAQQGQNDLLAYQLSVQEVNQLPLTDLDQKRQELLNVALADIQSAASTYFTPQRMTVAHILPMQEPAH